MALLYTDGFDHYTTLSAKGWSVNNGAAGNTSRGRFGAGSLFAQGGTFVSASVTFTTHPYIGRFLDGVYSSLFVGFAFKESTFGFSTTIVAFGTIELRVTGNGNIYMTRSGTQVGQTALNSTAMIPGSWYYLEFGGVISSTVGWCEARINGQIVSSYYGTGSNRAGANGNTGTGTFNYIQFGQSQNFSANTTGSGLNFDLDDLYICDSSGSTQNDFLGELRVVTLYPDGAGTTTQFTKGGTTPAATNHQSVDETPPNDDVDYVASSTVGNADTYNYQALPSNTATVHAVAASFVTRKDDAGARTAKVQVRTGGVQADGPLVPLNTSYNVAQNVMSVNPVTGLAWDPSEINSGEFGIKVIS